MKSSGMMAIYLAPLIAVLLSLSSVCVGQNTGFPEPLALYPLNKQYGTQDISSSKNLPGKAVGVELAPGFYGQPEGSYYFSGSPSSFIEFPNSGGLDARYSITLVAWIYPESPTGPIFHYKAKGGGVYLRLESPNKLSAKFEMRGDSAMPYAVQSDRIRLKAWNYVAASYDNETGTARLWIDGKEVSSLNIGRFELATQEDVRMGALVGDPHFYKGRVSCMQIYGKSLEKRDIDAVRDRCPVKVQSRYIGCYANKSPSAITSLEGKDPLLDGDPKTRQDAEQKCARGALKLGYVFFAIQDGGHCLSSITAQDTYNKYGLSTICQDSKGGKMAIDVYEIIIFRDQTCWNGWVASQDACYRLFSDQKTWAQAHASCQVERGSLAKLDSEDKNYFVFLQIVKPDRGNSNVWIGLSRDLDSKFHWPDGALAEYTNWSPGSPDNSQGSKKNCTVMNVYSGLWEDQEFDHTLQFVCGRVIPAMPRDLHLKLMDSHSALVTWTNTNDPQQAMTSFYVEYRVKGTEGVQLKVVQNQNSISLTGLQPNAEYHVRVRGVDGAGGGIWSHYKTLSTGKPFPPRIHPLSPVRATLQGEELVINCTANGGPEPTITWYKDQKFIQLGQTLVISNMTSENHGLYTCSASNGIEPDDTKSVAVTSLAAPVLNHLWGAATEKEVYIEKGAGLSLKCEMSNMTVASVTWYKDDKLLTGERYTYTSNNGVSVKEITGEDFGVYECQVSNSLGMASKKITVVNASRITSMMAAIGCLATLCVLLLIVVAVLTWFLLKARKTLTINDKEQLEVDAPPKPRGPRPSDSDIMIPEVRSTASPGMMSKGSNSSSYTPLKTVTSNGGTSTFKPQLTT